MNLHRCFLTLLLVFTGWVSGASAVPITAADQVVVNGTTWAQADLFTNLSWNNINSVCPSGNCSNGSTLNGYDMTGWVWASADAVASMFNFYLSAAGVPIANQIDLPAPNSYTQLTSLGVASSWISSFFADWRPTTTQGIGWSYVELQGTTYTGTGGANHGFIRTSDNINNQVNYVTVFNFPNQNYSNTNSGGFFYKSTLPSEPAPTPATLPLIALGLAALGLTRKKQAIHA